MENPFWPVIDRENNKPLCEQVVTAITNKVQAGIYSPGMPLPSLNEMTEILGISKETVYKCYARLCKSGILVSKRGKGYFISETGYGEGMSILVILDKMSAHQQLAMDSFISTIGDKAKITILTHYQNPDIFKSLIESEVGKYSYYVVFPHFKTDGETQYRILSLMKRIPANRLIVMDRLIPGLGLEYGAAYQSIEDDIKTGLQGSINIFKQYNCLYQIGLSTSLYEPIIGNSLKKFCRMNGIPMQTISDLPETIRKGDVYFVSGSRLGKRFVQLAEKILHSGLALGKDVGLICYNDFQINELILGGLTTLSTDFSQMGREAANMILRKKLTRVHCNCSFIRRATF